MDSINVRNKLALWSKLSLDHEARRVFVLYSTSTLSETEQYCELPLKAILGGLQFRIASDVMPVNKITLVLQEGSSLDWTHWNTSVIKSSMARLGYKGFCLPRICLTCGKGRVMLCTISNGILLLFSASIAGEGWQCISSIIKYLTSLLCVNWRKQSTPLTVITATIPSSFSKLSKYSSYHILYDQYYLVIRNGRLDLHWETGLHFNLVTSIAAHHHPFAGNHI